jgi:PhzF family phenazine biosynthesis protein
MVVRLRNRRPSAIAHGSEQWYDLELDLGLPNAYVVIDSFADPVAKVTGNPAAVVPLRGNPDSSAQVQWMQRVAQEFNLSETAFVWPWNRPTAANEEENVANDAMADGKEAHYGIRYFTPTVEVPLCGHATLAAAAALFQSATALLRPSSTIVFHAPDNVLRATSRGTIDARSERIAMMFPAMPTVALETNTKAKALQTILQSALIIDASDILYLGLVPGLGDVLVEVIPSSFRSMGYGERLNLNALASWEGSSRGWIVCCVAPVETSTPAVSAPEGTVEPRIDFCSRFFAPGAGIPEDPVTGSAHCALAPYFASKLHKSVMVGLQSSQRGGIVECELVANDEGQQLVKLTGTAVRTMSGVLSM